MIARAALSLVLLPALLGATRDDPLAGRVAGPARECLDLGRVQGPEIVDQRTILYRENGRRVWRTGPVGTCSTMRSGDALIVYLYGNQICRNDRFHVRAPGDSILGATCRFDAFVPYDKAS